jgi:formylglycine-generating enzyme required for sulfatase activity
MSPNYPKTLKTALAGVAAVAVITIIGLSCNDNGSGPGTNPQKDWRVSNWTPPDTSGYVTFEDGGVKIEMVLVQGGTFTMGCTVPKDSMCIFDDNNGFTWRGRCDGGMIRNFCGENEYPAHQVTVSSFYIAKFEMTHGLWKQITDLPDGYGDGWYNDSGYNNHALETMKWTDVSNFLQKLNAKTNKKYRLPTEAEWEFAARGGIRSKNRVFAGSDNPTQVAGNVTVPKPVGSKLPNELGIYDMSGDRPEVVSDWYAPYPSEPQINPQGPPTGEYHINRGAGMNERDLRVSARHSNNTAPCFRLALSVD